jgi:hypothetical protein
MISQKELNLMRWLRNNVNKKQLRDGKKKIKRDKKRK